MFSAKTDWRARLRTLLILGRVSNLPTVWSNCYAGWLLGGDQPGGLFVLLCAGATCLYVGGMYLNDAFDAEFDRQHRKERPIPSGAIDEREVWLWGIGWLVLGSLLLVSLGWTTAFLTLLLIAAILVYDAVHKAIAFSPVLMAVCRFLLYLVAASVSVSGVTGLAVWSGLALGIYIIGLSFLARQESTGGFLNYWPSYLLATPVGLAFLVNNGEYRWRGLVCSLILGIWVLRSLRHSFGGGPRNIGRTVSGLLAGIVLVDLLAVAGGSPANTLTFVALFLAALLFQRFIPAT